MSSLAHDHRFRHVVLDEDDHQGVRYGRLSCLLGAGLYREAQSHVKAHAGKGECVWSYGRALAAFGRHGKKAREALGRAIRENPVAALFLLDADVPESVPERAEEDAERCARELAYVWAETRGARRWLSRELEALARRETSFWILRSARRAPRGGEMIEHGMTEARADCGEGTGPRRGCVASTPRSSSRSLIRSCPSTRPCWSRPSVSNGRRTAIASAAAVPMDPSETLVVRRCGLDAIDGAGRIDWKNARWDWVGRGLMLELS